MNIRRTLLRSLRSRLPPALPLVGRAMRRGRGMVSMNLGRIASSKPLSGSWGYDRGTPIDRYYIEAFIARHASDVKGQVLEIQEDDYSRRFGGSRVLAQEILNIDATNPRATIIGDLTDPKTLPMRRFDCVILTQTLHLVFDMAAAIANVRHSLRPGGVLLVTVPGITPTGPGGDYDWYWSLTETALRRLLSERFDEDKVSVETFGNLFAATAFLHASAVQEVPRWKLDRSDSNYPVTVAGRAVA